MSSDVGVLKPLIVILTAAIVFMIAYQLVQDLLSTPRVDEFDIVFVPVDKRYSESNGILVVSLLNLGESLDFITKEDFKWYLDDHAMGTVHSICFTDGISGKWAHGQIIQLELRTEENLSNRRIKLTFRGIPIVFWA